MAVDALVQPSPGHLLCWCYVGRAAYRAGAGTLERILGFLFVAIAVELLTACSIIVPGLR
jgi:hypothetical protein